LVTPSGRFVRYLVRARALGSKILVLPVPAVVQPERRQHVGSISRARVL
jgi:hypothetical protein